MIEFIRNSNICCLRKMLLDYLEDDFAVAPEQDNRCCVYCNEDTANTRRHLYDSVYEEGDEEGNEEGDKEGEGYKKAALHPYL